MEESEDELIRLMHERFMNGGDTDNFDYASVDKNDKYDDLQQIS